MLLDDMERLYFLKKELRAESKKYKDRVKPLRDEAKILEADIINQVLKEGKTITAGGIQAEYKPTVVIRIKKEDEEKEG